MAKKVLISAMLKHYYPHAVLTGAKAKDPPPSGQYGYVMGGDGRVATDDYIRQRAKSSYGDNWRKYYEAYKKWLGRKVFDCNALAEAYYKQETGENIDTKARYNYANWCGEKSASAPEASLAGLPQKPGVAVFSGSSAPEINHVGFLLYRYGSGRLDWYVLECRGKDYGLVITKLKDRPWRWWGVMDKYFTYDAGADWKPDEQNNDDNNNEEENEMAGYVFKNVRPMQTGTRVKKLQDMLDEAGYDPKGVDGKYGDNTHKAFLAFLEAHKSLINVGEALPSSMAITVEAGGKRYSGTVKAG